jgi:pyridoxal/pyridoxine/pyridoxamine kinase
MVALSSSEIGGSSVLLAFLSCKKLDGSFERFKMTIPKQGNVHLTGTGDLFAALLLAHSTKLPNDLGRAFELTIAAVQSVIETTLATLTDDKANGLVKVSAQERELKIIQSKKHIEEPVVKLRAVKIE